jgi:predicted acylesterase/phospholipase RssA
MFDKVVFAGGGHRCWWQAGFWDEVSGGIELHPRVIAGVSFGAVVACLLHAGDSRRALTWYERELKTVRSNFNWLNLARRDRRLMPHAAIQRKALRALLGGDSFRQLMWRAPEIRVQYARLPEGASPSRAVLGALLARRLHRPSPGAPGADAARRAGMTLEVKRIQDCRSERELVDLLAAANCAPPFSAVEVLDGAPCLDAGLVDELAVGAVADVPGQTLVLATRRDPSLAPVSARDGFVYVQPSERVPVGSWDYTSAARFQKAYDLGRRDGEAFLRTFALGQYCEAGLRLVTPAATESSGAASGSREDAASDQAAEVTGPAGEPVGRADAAGDGVAGEQERGVEAAGARAAGVEHADEAAARVTALSRPAAAVEVADEPAVEKGRLPVARAAAAPMVASRSRADAASDGDLFAPMHATDDADRDDGGVLDVSAKLAAYREPTDAGMAADLSASQPAASEGQARSGRSLRASNT